MVCWHWCMARIQPCPHPIHPPPVAPLQKLTLTSRFCEAVKLINTVSPTKFPLLLRRIIAKLSDAKVIAHCALLGKDMGMVQGRAGD